MKIELKLITPYWAKKTLDEKNIGNRAINQRHVESLANEMKNGRWKLNGDTICINDLRLIDGQHRLAAVVLSGVTIQGLVIYGVSDDVFDTKDVGKRRSAGDTLGVLGEKNANRLAAALALVDKYMTGRADMCVAYTNTQIQALLEKYPDVPGALQTSLPTNGLIAKSVLDTCYYLFSKKDKDLADEFVQKLLLGADLKEGTPWYVLRERLVRNAHAKAKLTKQYVFALCIKAWNATRELRRVRNLRWREEGDSSEAFPVVK